MKRLSILIVLVSLLSPWWDRSTAAEPDKSTIKVLVFSGTGYYRHPDIPVTNGWLVRLGAANGMEVDVTVHAENAA